MWTKKYVIVLRKFSMPVAHYLGNVALGEAVGTEPGIRNSFKHELGHVYSDARFMMQL